MSILVVLPVGNIDKHQIQRVLNHLNNRFTNENLLFAIFDFSLNVQKSFFDKFVILKTKEKKFFLNQEQYKNLVYTVGAFNKIVILKEQDNTNPPFEWDASLMSLIEFYRDLLFGYGGLTRIGGINDSSKSVFSKASASRHDCLLYYPYGYLYKSHKFPEINEFGFRIEKEFKHLRNRSKDHLLILFFGGSSCFDLYAEYDNMISTLVGHNLTNRLGRDVSVLNFAIPSHTVLYELSTYMLFGDELKPDLVVFYDGFNDMIYGQCGDSFLLHHHNITYPKNMETWACQLGSEGGAHNDFEYICKNLASSVVKSYFERIVQSQNIVNAKFISVLQPLSMSKNLLSSEELFLMQFLKFPQFDKLFKNIEFLFSKYRQYQKRYCLIENFFDMDLYVQNHFSDSKNLSMFCDIVHTLPQGNNIIALALSDYIAKIVKKDFV